MDFRIDFYCVNIMGSIRKNNEDNFYALGRYRRQDETDNDIAIKGSFSSSDNQILAVYDGMGGENCGEIASLMAACGTEKYCGNVFDSVVTLNDLCSSLNNEIFDYANSNNLGCVGTTAALLLFSDKIYACNLGDSRVYKISNNFIDQISMDHSMPAPKRRKAPLTQFLGLSEDEIQLSPFITQGEYNVGDKYLICSDGITDLIDESEILKIITVNSSIETATDMLVSLAIQRGGIDNITIIMCDIR